MLILNRRGPVVTYSVRYAKGRKPFDKLEGKDPSIHARAFAEDQRKVDGGWAEISRVTTEIVERKR